MSTSIYKTVNFGKTKSGLATVGYTVGGTRTTSGVSEVVTGSGVYGATVTVADTFAGAIVWDTGEGTPSYAADEINPSDPLAAAVPGSYAEGTAGYVLGGTAPYLNAFLPATVSASTTAQAFTLTFAGSAPPAASLSGRQVILTTAGRAPEKGVVSSASVVDGTRLAITLLSALGVAPQVGDAVLVG